MSLFSRQKYTDRAKTAKAGPVEYLDGSALERPQVLGWKRYILVIVCMVLACGVGAFAFYQTYDGLVLAPEREKEATVSALEKKVDYNLPQLLDLIELSDSEMHSALLDAGNVFVMLEAYPEDPADSEGFDMYRVTPELAVAVADTYLTKGISTLKQSQAAILLNGSWRYTVYRYLTCAVRIQYADLGASTPEDAIAHALSYQGWDDPDTYTDKGVDSNGNTFQAGQINIDGKSYEWRVSTVTLQEMYGLDLPTDAMFVGVRITQILA